MLSFKYFLFILHMYILYIVNLLVLLHNITQYLIQKKITRTKHVCYVKNSIPLVAKKFFLKTTIA